LLTYHAVLTFTTQGGTQQPPNMAALYPEGLSTAKLLPHTVHSSWSTT